MVVSLRRCVILAHRWCCARCVGCGCRYSARLAEEAGPRVEPGVTGVFGACLAPSFVRGFGVAGLLPRHPGRRAGGPLFWGDRGRSGTPGRARGDGCVAGGVPHPLRHPGLGPGSTGPRGGGGWSLWPSPSPRGGPRTESGVTGDLGRASRSQSFGGFGVVGPFPRHPGPKSWGGAFLGRLRTKWEPGSSQGRRGVGLAGCLFRSVTPDLVRGPPGRGGRLEPLAVPLAAGWTPERVRGDGGFGACLALPFGRGIWVVGLFPRHPGRRAGGPLLRRLRTKRDPGSSPG